MELGEKSRLYPANAPNTRRSTGIQKGLIVLVIITSVAAVTLFVALIATYRSNSLCRKELPDNAASDYCNTTSCVSTASNLLKSVDTSVDPCEDFYQFSCGNWIKSAHLIGGRDTQFVRLERKVLENVKELLESPLKDENAEHLKKTKKFYSACMNTVRRNDNALPELRRDLEKFGGWPLLKKDWESGEFDWIDLMEVAARAGYSTDMLINIRVTPYIEKVSMNMISLYPPSLGMVSKIFYDLKDNIDAYKNLILGIAKALSPNLNETQAKNDIEKAFNIEKSLAVKGKKWKSSEGSNGQSVIMTLKELEELASEIDWKLLLKKMLKDSPDLNDDEIIAVVDAASVKVLNDILVEIHEKKDDRALADYMFYRMVLQVSPHLSKNILQLLDLMDSSYETKSQWETCLKMTSEFFHPSITATYVNTYMKNEKRTMLKNIYNGVVSTYETKLKNTQWMDTETKKNALKKINSLKAALGFHKDFLNVVILNAMYKNIEIGDNHLENVKRMQRMENLHKVSGLREKNERFGSWRNAGNMLTAIAYYKPIENAIIIPVGMSDDLILHPERPSYINYGMLGAVIGHEVAHAFDNNGGLYDADGNYNTWWTAKSWERFRTRARCFVDQYSKYHEANNDVFVNGTVTLGENIADTEGVRAAYQAYVTSQGVPNEKPLPGLQFTNHQMFWIAYASVWCRRQTDDSLQYSYKSSVHTPARFRIKGALSNLKEFADDFNCKVESAMNPKSKCSLWDH